MRMYLLETTDALRVDAPAPQRLWLGARVGGAGVHRRRPEDDRVCPVGGRPGVHTRRLPPPVCTRPPSQLRGRMVRRACRPLPRAARAARGPSASRSTRPSERRAPSCALCGVRPRRMSRNTRHRCTSSATLSAPAGPARPAGDHEPQACAGLARGARRLRRGQARARRVVRRAGPTVCPPSGASLRDADGNATQRSIPTLRECRRPGAARLAVRLWPCD
jgi:hypothetical protein